MGERERERWIEMERTKSNSNMFGFKEKKAPFDGSTFSLIYNIYVRVYVTILWS